MSSEPRTIAVENPFCTRRVRPGALPFLLPDDQPLPRLVDRLRRQGWWGQIIGAHGSGKSALLASLVPAIEQAGLSVCRVELHDGQRRLPIDVRKLATRGGLSPFSRRTSFSASTTHPGRENGTVPFGRPADALVLVVDGFEQLGRLRRVQLKRFCRRRRWGLVVTTHVPLGLPELYRTAPDVALAQRLVERLQRGYNPRIDDSDVAEAYAEHREDLRETLFALYDRYEQRRRSTRGEE